MKIAIVIYAIRIGGAESVMLSLASFLAGRGNAVDFVEVSSKGEWSPRFERLGFRVRRILPAPFESKVRHARRLARVLGGYDLLILNDVPSVQSVLGLLPERVVAISVLHNDLESMIVNASSNSSQLQHVVCVSPGLKNRVLERGLMPSWKVSVISNGVHVDRAWAKSPEDFQQSGLLRVLFAGRIEHGQKGVLYLPLIMRALQQAGRRIELTVVGDGPSLPELREAVQACNVQASVELLGSQGHERVLELMRQCHVLLMPSHYEGQGIVLMEAMALGVVPVASRLVGYNDDIVADGHSGLLCEPGNVESFAKAIARLDDDRHELMRMSKHAWLGVLKQYSVESMGIRYVRLMDGIRRDSDKPLRNGEVLAGLLGDCPCTPRLLVRPVRKLKKILTSLTKAQGT